MLRPFIFAAGLGAWGASIYGATQLHRLDIDLGRGVCGPWGCAAAPEALLGYHLLLMSVIAPGIALVALWLTPQKAVRLGRGAVLLGGATLFVLFAWGAIGWLADGGATRYTLNSGLFRVATMPDLPALPVLFGGIAARILGWARGGCCGGACGSGGDEVADPLLEGGGGGGET